MGQPDLSGLEFQWAASMPCVGNKGTCPNMPMLVSDTDLVLAPGYACEDHLLKIAVWVERMRYLSGE